MTQFPAFLKGLLARPFPQPVDSSRSFLITAGSFGVFVTLFLSLFTPIGLNEVPVPLLYVHTVIYGVLCSVIMLLNSLVLPFLFPRAFEGEGWNVGKHIGFSLWMILTITLGNVAYSVWQFHFQVSLSTMITFWGTTLLIGIFPTTVLTLLQERRLLRRNIDAAHRISAHLHESVPHDSRASAPSSTEKNGEKLSQHTIQKNTLDDFLLSQPTKRIVFEGASIKEYFEAPPDAIVCLQSNDNYVMIIALMGSELQTAMLRMTLKSAEERTSPYARIIRCHKSYIVNLDHVHDISGNAQGYKLHIPVLDFPVPVSRSYQDRVLRALEY